MAKDRFKNLSEEQRALHESWDDLGRVVLLVSLTASVIWAICAGLKKLVHAVGDGLLAYVAEGDSVWGALVLVGALTAGGVIRGVLNAIPSFRDAAGDGIDVALRNYHITYRHPEDDPQPRYDLPAFGLVLRKALATLVTLGTGGSGGLEGPVVLLGEATGAGVSRVMAARSEHELRTYQLAGIAAAVATLLNAPFASALFAIEVVYGDRIIYRKLAYGLLAGTIAYVLNNKFLGYTPVFQAPPHAHTYELWEYGITAIVAIAVSAPIALGFGLTMRHAQALVERVPPLARGVVGGVGTAAVALAFSFGLGLDVRHTLGMGDYTLRALLVEQPAHELTLWWFLILALVGKMLTTGLTVQSGGSAGLLIPSMFLGGVSGAAMGRLLEVLGVFNGQDTAVFVVVGIACALVAMVGVPMAAIALVLEIFGTPYGPPAILACGVTYVLTLRLSVYGNQARSPSPIADEVGATDLGVPVDDTPPRPDTLLDEDGAPHEGTLRKARVPGHTAAPGDEGAFALVAGDALRDHDVGDHEEGDGRRSDEPRHRGRLGDGDAGGGEREADHRDEPSHGDASDDAPETGKR